MSNRFYPQQVDYVDVLNAADGELQTTRTQANSIDAEVTAARDGETSLSNKLQSLSSDTVGVEGEVVAARDGEVSLIAQVDTLQARLGALETWAENASDFDQDNRVAVDGLDINSLTAVLSSATDIVDVFVYDTRLDSDGGAWRQRCSGTSWYNETLSTATRGTTKRFPAVVAIVAEADRVIIYDLTRKDFPMWMVFDADVPSVSLLEQEFRVPPYTDEHGPLQSVTAGQGEVVVGGEGYTASNQEDRPNALCRINFIADEANYRNSVLQYRWGRGLAKRNAEALWSFVGQEGIANNVVNDVAITVLDDAPIDNETGLPVPTIYVTTDGGVSRIAHDGTISSTATGSPNGKISLSDQYAVVMGNYASPVYIELLESLPSGGGGDLAGYWGKYLEASGSGYPSILTNSVRTVSDKALSCGQGLMRTEVGTYDWTTNAAPNVLMAYIASDYNSGWMPGDIKGAWLSSTVGTTLTGSELVTNGDFPTTTTGWSATNANLSVVSAALELANSGANYGVAYQAITTEVGKFYAVSTQVKRGTTSGIRVYVGVSSGDNTLAASDTVTSTSFVPVFLTFIATGTTTYISFVNQSNTDTHTGYADDVSVRIGVEDRSVNDKGLQVNGTITRSAVATNAELVAYSGFSTSNYLEQAYNSDLDFGTGDFYVLGWIMPNFSSGGILDRDSNTANTNTGIVLYGDGGELIAEVAAVSVEAWPPADVWSLFCLCRRSGTIYLSVNAGEEDSASSSDDLDDTSATLMVGAYSSGSVASDPYGGDLALLRMGAGAPSAEQIKHIYGTEKFLFQEDADCTLAGSSDAILGLAHDPVTDLLHAMTSYGRSTFDGLQLVDSEATAVGTPVAVSAVNGALVQAGDTGAAGYLPAKDLRDELNRSREQAEAFGAPLQQFDQSSGASDTTFWLDAGWKPVAVYWATSGNLSLVPKDDYSQTSDGFRYGVEFDSAPGSGTVAILAQRN